MTCFYQKEHACGNIFMRKFNFLKLGHVVEGHAHNFDHTTILFKGKLRVELLDGEGPEANVLKAVELAAPNHLLIQAGKIHRITVLEDDTWYWCVYSHRLPQGEVVQEYTGWEEAYR